MLTETVSRFALLVSLCAGAAFAADSYPISLKMGDEYRSSGEFDLAIEEYDAAVAQAATDNEKALALAKKGLLYVYDRVDLAQARGLANQALALSDLSAVAEVAALEVKARVLMNADQNFPAAAEALERALELEGVEYVQPSLALILGDAYRSAGAFKDAIKAYERVMEFAVADDAIKGVAYLNIGITEHYNLQSKMAARRAYEKAAELNPGLQGEVDNHLSNL